MNSQLHPALQALSAAKAALVLSLALVLATQLGPARAAGTDTGAYEVIANAFGFSCDIPGAPESSKNIREISIDELTIDPREVPGGRNGEPHVHAPGQVHYGDARFTVAAGTAASKELAAWFADAARGKNIRKTITVTLFKSDKSPGRSYNFHECFPIRWTPAIQSSPNAVPAETLTVKIGRIEFKTGAAPPADSSVGEGTNPRARATSSDTFAQVRGFSVELHLQAGKEVDTAWESVSGGELMVALTETATGSDKFTTFSPGHKTVGEITLRGSMTTGRKQLCDWINDTVMGRPWRRSLTITELLSVDGAVKDGKQYLGSSAYPIRYRFPHLSVENMTGNAEEELTYRWVRSVHELPPHPRGILDIPGAPLASSEALAIAVEDLAMDMRLVPTTGDARNPSALLVLPDGAERELAAWLKNTQAGIPDLRTVSVALLNGRKLTGQVLKLLDCVPLGWEEAPGGNKGVLIKPIRVELR